MEIRGHSIINPLHAWDFTFVITFYTWQKGGEPCKLCQDKTFQTPILVSFLSWPFPKTERERKRVDRPRENLKLSSFFNCGTLARNKSPFQLVELKETGERDQNFPTFILARQEVNLLARHSIFSRTPRWLMHVSF